MIWLNLALVIGAKVGIDYWQWKRKIVINHWVEIAMVVIQVSLVTYWLAGLAIGLLLLESAVYWLVFDPLMALAIGQALFYIGNTAYPDKLFYGRKYGEAWILLGKVLYLIMAIFAFALL